MLDDPAELFNTIPGVDETLAERIDFKQSVNAANWRTPGEHYQLMPQITRQKVDSKYHLNILGREKPIIWLNPRQKRLLHSVTNTLSVGYPELLRRYDSNTLKTILPH